MTPNTETLLILFVAITGVAVLLQACILLAIFIALRKAAKSMSDSTGDLKASVLPMVRSTRDLIERITPQVITITAGLADLTETVKRESGEVKISVTEILERVNNQVKRLDTLLTHGLNAVEQAGNVLETTVSAPVRQVNGVVAAIKAIIGTYRSTTPVRAPVPPASPYSEASDSIHNSASARYSK